MIGLVGVEAIIEVNQSKMHGKSTKQYVRTAQETDKTDIWPQLARAVCSLSATNYVQSLIALVHILFGHTIGNHQLMLPVVRCLVFFLPLLNATLMTSSHFGFSKSFFTGSNLLSSSSQAFTVAKATQSLVMLPLLTIEFGDVKLSLGRTDTWNMNAKKIL